MGFAISRSQDAQMPGDLGAWPGVARLEMLMYMVQMASIASGGGPGLGAPALPPSPTPFRSAAASTANQFISAPPSRTPTSLLIFSIPSSPSLPLARHIQALAAAAASPAPGLAAGAAANSLVYVLGLPVLLKGLTWEGVLSSWFLGTLSYSAFGPGAYALVCLYFIVGSLVTKLRLAQKQREGIAEARSGRRGVVRVVGNIAVGFAVVFQY